MARKFSLATFSMCNVFKQKFAARLIVAVYQFSFSAARFTPALYLGLVHGCTVGITN